MQVIQRFNNLTAKIDQIKSMISNATGEEAPELLNLNMIVNLEFPQKGNYSLFMSPDECKVEKGENPFAAFTLTAEEKVWNDIFDGNTSLFGAYAVGRLKANKYRANRFNIFLLSGLISFLLDMKIKL